MATLREVAEHFNLSRQAMAHYLRAHQAELNEGGEHVRLVGGEWQIDAIGLARLEDMRGFNHKSAAADLAAAKESGQVINNLQTALVTMQSERREQDKALLAVQAKIITLQEQYMEQLRRDSERRAADAAALAGMQKDIAHERAENERLRQAVAGADERVADADARADEAAASAEELAAELRRLKNRGFWARVFNQ